ncbi:MAG: hypothetical protein KME50_35610 [Nostoc desertorum CM1-VF14]|jgi:hypothetical protein|nr:hypothetical protein [Nostoc desertorum CM1-VF14]
MKEFQTIFQIPDWIVQGLESLEYVRIGGVIRDAKTKQIIAMLREITPDISQASKLLTQAGSVASLLNLGVSILNLGITVIGFSLVLKRLKEIEQGLEEDLNSIEESINSLHRKFDISVYANFGAALELASDATTMLQVNNRKNFATLAISRFLEAQHIYSKYVEISIKENISLADKYILSLVLAYVARVRCYLELEEINNAVFCLQEGTKILRHSIQQYIKSLLTSQPIARELPSFQGGPIIDLYSPVELYRLSNICKWLEPELNCILNEKFILFEAQRIKLVKFLQYERNDFPIIGYCGAFLYTEEKVEKKECDFTKKEENNLYNLFKVVKIIEQTIETYNRFEAYLLEVQVIQEQGMSFQKWLQFASHTEAQQHPIETMCIIQLQPFNL